MLAWVVTLGVVVGAGVQDLSGQKALPPPCEFDMDGRAPGAPPPSFHVEVDADGRAVALPIRPLRPSGRLRVGGRDCSILVAVKKASWTVRGEFVVSHQYFADTRDAPDLTTQAELPDPTKPNAGDSASHNEFQIWNVPWKTADERMAMLAINLWQVEHVMASGPDEQRLRDRFTALAAAKAADDGLKAREKAVEDAEKEVESATQEIAKTKSELARLDEEAKLLAGNSHPDAVKALLDTLVKAAQSRITLGQQELAEKKKKEAVAKEKKALASDRRAFELAHGEISNSREELDEIERRLPTDNKAQKPQYLRLRKAAVLLLAGQSRLVYYDFRLEPVPPAALGGALRLMGAYPVMKQGDRGYALVINRVLDTHPHPFSLLVTRQAGTPVTMASIRPTLAIPVAKELADASTFRTQRVLRDPKYPGGEGIELKDLPIDPASLRTAFRDVVLPFGEPLQGNTIPIVSISTYIAGLATDKVTTKQGPSGNATDVLKEVSSASRALVSEVKYPQVRPLYRFNYTTGVLVSFLKDPSFTKVKAKIDDPTTKMETEPTTYTNEEDAGEPRLMPAFLFTVYWKRVDTQESVYRRFGSIFAPTIGFSLTSPADNFFAGFTYEFLESSQLFVGANWGKVKQLAFVRDVDELANDKAPVTRSVRKPHFVVGVSFNINLIASIFQ